MNRRTSAISSLASALLIGGLAASASSANGVHLVNAAAIATATHSIAQTKSNPTPANAGDDASLVKMSDGELKFDFLTHDFGLQPSGKKLNVRFPFKNTGDETVVIRSTRTSCGCTAAVLDTKTFEPGEGSYIDVTYEPKGTNRQTKTVTVSTNSNTRPSITLNVTANVVQLIDVTPRTLQFGQVLVGKEEVRYLTVFSKDPEMKIKDLEMNGQFPITAEVVDEIPDEVREGFPGKQKIKLTIPGNLDIGRVHATLKITTLAAFQDGERPDVQEEHYNNVSILGRVVGNLQASPSAIRMLPLQPNEDFSYTTRITHRNDEKINLTDGEVKLLRSSIPGVTATLEPFEEGPRSGYVLTIKGNSGNHRGAFRGTFALTPEMEGEPPLRINFSGTVRARN